MLIAKLKAEENFGLPRSAELVDLPPNTPASTIRLTIHFAGLGEVFGAWLSSERTRNARASTGRIQTSPVSRSKRSTLRILAPWLAALLPVLAIAADVFAREVMGTPHLLESAATLLLQALKAHSQGLVWLCLCGLAWLLSFRLLRRTALCTIHIVLLRPHEPLPPIPPSLLRRRNTHVFAVRALGHDARQKFFGFLERRAGTPKTYESTSWELCEPVRGKRMQQVPWRDYWSLVRCCLTYMLPQNTAEPEFGVASSFTAKQHRSLLRFYLFLILLSVLPSIAQHLGLLSEVPKELKQYLAAAAIGWVTVGIMLHRLVSLHLRRWEKHTRTFPFRGSPILKRIEDADPHQWVEVPTDTYELPMRTFGMSYAQLQQIVLAVLLVIFLTLLQLIG
ncbi:hypothetical protein HZ992_18935 [Rhizobacter sp. AJA081-3]|uniref:hypothetical protein n=1 Tax=Rhizobacter sp. AJA081-3 TaxID=2753607 RepID=UPI001ADF39B9|nr:hypothetical protein [Rhizobacter sp. AJA081-3]QTN22216.1 hypothetical protein HZ992_18935 [Rhizobacter sp. AJA081-3]